MGIIKKYLNSNWFRVAAWFFLLFNILAALCSIYSCIYSIIDASISDMSLTNKTMIVIAIVLCGMGIIFSIIMIIENRQRTVDQKTRKITEGFRRICQDFKDEIFNVDYNNFDTKKSYYKEVTVCSKVIVDRVAYVLAKVLGCDVRVCIKYFENKYTDIKDMELITLCRSTSSVHESIHEQKMKIKVIDNTDFEYIISEKTDHFSCCNLLDFKGYKNSTEGWGKNYICTIVYPIRVLVLDERNKPDYYDLLGFLCVDTKNKKALNNEFGVMCVDFVASIADLLYIFFNRCIEYQRLMDENNYKESYYE